MKRITNIQYFHMVQSCWHYAQDKRLQMVLFYSLTVFANIVLILQPYVIGELVNTLQLGGDNLLSDTTYWLSINLGLILLFWAFHGPSRIIERRLAVIEYRSLLQRFYFILTQLPMRWHYDNHSGNTVNRINKAALALWEFSDGQFVYVQSFIALVGSIVVLAIIDIQIAGILLIFTLFNLFVIRKFDKYIIPKIHETNEYDHAFFAKFFDFVTNITSVVSFNLRKFTQKELTFYFNKEIPPYYKTIWLVELKWFTMLFFSAVVEFAVIYNYISYHLENNIPLMVGTLVAIFQYIVVLNKIFQTFATNYQKLVRQHTNLQSIDSIEDDFNSTAILDTSGAELKVTDGNITLTNMSFNYTNSQKVFTDFNLSISAGQRVGVVGASGAGKSTFINLLMRFYDPTSGAITIDNQNLTEVSQSSLRRNIALIPQDTSLFEDTLLENIRFGRLDATDEEVVVAAKKAHADEFINKLNDTYNTEVGERGVKLSGGQRQRIAIARAILKNAPILILDEATSALDSESEKHIQSSLKELMAGKTVIAIAHRLSTISHMDRILVFDNGKIVEDGNHDELLALGGIYAKLWDMQSGGFLPA